MVRKYPSERDGQGPELKHCISIQVNTLQEKSRTVLKHESDERITQASAQIV